MSNVDYTQIESLYQHSGPERVGFIIGEKVVEVENIHPDPSNFFEVSQDDLEQYLAKAHTIWHTQPGKKSQLSYADYLGFINFPDHKHMVVGLDGYRIYKVEDGQVIKDSICIR